MTSKTILVTGGAGYIGSHMVRVLLEAGHKPIIFDNLSTGHKEFIPKGVPFIKGDLRSVKDIEKVFLKHSIDAVIHFAALIVVSESVMEPMKYYQNNVIGTLNLLQSMIKHQVKHIVFSSSACVYGQPDQTPVKEEAPFRIENPYGATKVMVEQILADLAKAKQMNYVALRYFNVAGAHPSGLIGIKTEHPTHLIPNVMMVAQGKKKELKIFGTDYPTKDGTAVRDYIHVLDLCEAHLLALTMMFKLKHSAEMINLGNGKGFSVLEVVQTTQEVLKKKINVKFCSRREGDAVCVVASFDKAKKLLGWAPRRDLKEIITSAWHWEQKRP